MQVKTLRELIDTIPFLRYNEDNLGLTNPTYADYQPYRSSELRVYINDREVVIPYSGGGLKAFGQADIGYIDHVEIYMGTPSAELGIESSAIVIKAYTKSPERENGTLTGIAGGSYGAHEIYGQSAYALDEIAYYAYLGYRNFKRKKKEHADTELSKDKESTNFYGQLEWQGSRFELQAFKGRFDQFIGSSADATPIKNDTKIDYLYGGWYYVSSGGDFKASLNYARSRSTHEEIDDKLLGILSLDPLTLYNRYRLRFFEEIANAKISQSFQTESYKLLGDIQYRHKHFKPESYEVGYDSYTRVDPAIPYDHENIVSGFLEASYLANARNMLTLTFKADRYFASGSVEDDTVLSGRIGYIYHDATWTAKIFWHSSQFRPDPQVIYQNATFLLDANELNNLHQRAFSGEIIYQRERMKLPCWLPTPVTNECSISMQPATTTAKIPSMSIPLLCATSTTLIRSIKSTATSTPSTPITVRYHPMTSTIPISTPISVRSTQSPMWIFPTKSLTKTVIPTSKPASTTMPPSPTGRPPKSRFFSKASTSSEAP